MKSVMISRLFPSASAPTFGLFNLELARALARRCSLEVIAPVPNVAGNPAELRGVRVRYPRFYSVPLLNRAMVGHSMARTLRRLRLQADVILATFAWPDGFAAVQTGLPVVIKCGGSDIDLLPASGPRRAQTLFALQRCRHIYVVAAHLRDQVVRLGVPSEKISIIRNGVDTSLFRPRDQATARREAAYRNARG